MWLICDPCQVVWETAGAAPCWLCEGPGRKTQHPMLAGGSYTEEFSA